MAKRGFSVRFAAVDPEPGFDGLAAVFNQASAASGARVVVTDIRAYPCTGMNSDATNALGNQGIIGLERITAASGGSELASVKHDTNASALDSGIKLRILPSAVTISGGTLRRFGDAFSFGITQAIPLQAQLRAPGIVDNSDDGRPFEGHNVWRADGIAETETIVLRPGEGIAAIKRAYGVPQAHHWNIVVSVSGKTYRYPVRDTGSPCGLGDAIWSLMNDSGAAVVSVMVVSMPDIGESNIPRYRLSRIGGYEQGGTVVSAVAHDTQSDLSALKAVQGPFIASWGNGLTMNYLNYQGTPISIAEQQKMGTFRQWLGLVGFVTETGAGRFQAGALGRGPNEVEVWPGERRGAALTPEGFEDVIVLAPGEGLAVIGGGNGLIETSEAAFLDIEVVGYVETPSINQPRLGFQLGI